MNTAFLDGILITVQITAIVCLFFLTTKAGNKLSLVSQKDIKISVRSFPVPKRFLALNRLDGNNNLKKQGWVKEKKYYDTQKRKKD